MRRWRAVLMCAVYACAALCSFSARAIYLDSTIYDMPADASLSANAFLTTAKSRMFTESPR